MSRPTFYKWFRRFSHGREEIKDDKRSGKPTVMTKKRISEVKELVISNRRITQDEICQITDLSKGSVNIILHKHLHMRKVVCTRILLLLTV